jgi:hypothetical protein
VASPLPPLYERGVEQLLGEPIPPEDAATCRDCVMIPGPDDTPCADQTYFDSTTRCCTYLRELPNFLLGPILGETDPRWTPGRLSVEARLERKVAVTPLGLGRPAPYALL